MSFTFIEGLKTAVKEITPKLIRQAFARSNAIKKHFGRFCPPATSEQKGDCVFCSGKKLVQ